MKIKCIDHISINTLDIQQSIDFYEYYFGFKEIERADMGEIELVYLKIDEHARLELFNLHGVTIDKDREETSKGLRHIAFKVDDIEAWNRDFKKKNAPFTMEITKMKPIRSIGILIEDPNGVIIELIERY